MLNVKMCLLVGCAIDNLLHESSVIGMHSLQYQLQCGLSCSIVFKDVVSFL